MAEMSGAAAFFMLKYVIQKTPRLTRNGGMEKEGAE
jgi:hypothetical protein